MSRHAPVSCTFSTSIARGMWENIALVVEAASMRKLHRRMRKQYRRMRKMLWHALMGFRSSIIKACAMLPRGTPRHCYLAKCAKHELEIDRGVACANPLLLSSTLSPFSCYQRAPIDAPLLQARLVFGRVGRLVLLLVFI